MAKTHDVESLPWVPGIRVGDVMERMGVSWMELRARLLQFARDHRRAFTELRSALDADDFESAQHICLDVAVASVNFGADSLCEKLRVLERALRLRQEFYEHLFDEAEMEYSGLVKAIDRIAELGGTSDIRDVIRSLYDFRALRAALDTMQQGLRRKDWKAADKALEQVRDLGVPPDVLEGFRELEKLVRDRVAEDALEMAGILKQNLE